MIIVCTILGTILLLISVWFCHTLYSDFCRGKKNEAEKSGHSRRYWSRRSDDVSCELSKNRSTSFSQLRRSHFGGSSSRSASYPCRSSRCDDRYRPSSRQKYRKSGSRYADDLSSSSGTFSNCQSSKIPAAECSKSLSSSQSERRIPPYPLHAEKVYPPFPATNSHKNLPAHKFAKYTEKQKKFNFKGNSGGLLKSNTDEESEESYWLKKRLCR